MLGVATDKFVSCSWLLLLACFGGNQHAVSKSGVSFGPLGLLAMEVYETLYTEGYRCRWAGRCGF